MAITPKQGKHIADISAASSRRIEAKYRKGQKEHGGNLWEKEGMLANIEDETTDLIVYVHTLREQIEQAYGLLTHIDRQYEAGKALKAREILGKIIGKPND